MTFARLKNTGENSALTLAGASIEILYQLCRNKRIPWKNTFATGTVAKLSEKSPKQLERFVNKSIDRATNIIKHQFVPAQIQ